MSRRLRGANDLRREARERSEAIRNTCAGCGKEREHYERFAYTYPAMVAGQTLPMNEPIAGHCKACKP